MDGFEVLEHLASSEAHCRIPVIVVTGREDVAAIDRAYRAGATSFVVKPLNWRQLSYQIRYVHRTARNEAGLLQWRQEAAADAERATAALEKVAREGARFLQSVVQQAPALRDAALDYASSLHLALEKPVPGKAAA
jgi:FixJ family two-component response regulator